jgi:hypothetical protein
MPESTPPEVKTAGLVLEIRKFSTDRPIVTNDRIEVSLKVQVVDDPNNSGFEVTQWKIGAVQADGKGVTWLDDNNVNTKLLKTDAKTLAVKLPAGMYRVQVAARLGTRELSAAGNVQVRIEPPKPQKLLGDFEVLPLKSESEPTTIP